MTSARAMVGLLLIAGAHSGLVSAQRQPVGPIGPPSSESYCAPQAAGRVAQAVRPGVALPFSGRISCSRDPARPVIILVHGLHQNTKTWTAPSDVEYAYDASRLPPKPKVEDFANLSALLAYSPWLYGSDRAGWDRKVNWFDFLADQGFTVATWSQPGTTIADAWESTWKTAEYVLNLTRDRNPGAPPPVAFIGHSRGGLMIRKLLKEKRTMEGMTRVRWVVTLHSPHSGSEQGRYPGRMIAELVDAVDCCAPQIITQALKPKLKEMVTELMRPMTKLIVDDESRELIPDSPTMRALVQGETPMPGVKYYTFGGTNPSFFRLYAWLYTPANGITAVELTPVSPALDGIRDYIDEVKPGRGDGLVTNLSSRLPWSTHFTTTLNHAQVLWDPALQTQVLRLIEPAAVVRRSQPN